MMTESQGTKNSPATRESLGLKDSAWDEAQGTKNWPTTKDLPSLCPKGCSCRAERTLPGNVVSFPLFAGMSGVAKACIAVLVRYASSLHGIAKLELLPPLFLKVSTMLGLWLLPSMVFVPCCCGIANFTSGICMAVETETVANRNIAILLHEVVLCVLTTVCQEGCACSPTLSSQAQSLRSLRFCCCRTR